METLAHLDRLREYAQRVELSETREDLGKLYEDIVGYNLLEDEPDATIEHMRDMCAGFLREECYSLGIHCEDVFNPCVTDETRSNGPSSNTISYDFKDGQLIRLFHGRPEEAWCIYSVPDEILREAISWNDRDGDFEDVSRVHMLEIFLADFVINACSTSAQP
jgi:hypothetical protein